MNKLNAIINSVIKFYKNSKIYITYENTKLTNINRGSNWKNLKKLNSFMPHKFNKYAIFIKNVSL